MENKNEVEVIISNLLFYDLSDLEFKPTAHDSAFSNQINYGNSLKNKPDALFKKKSKWFNNEALTKDKLQELAKKSPKKLFKLFVNLQKDLEIYQLQEPSSNFENFKVLKKFYVEIIKQVRDNIFKSKSTSRKSQLWKHFYRFSDLQAPYPKTLELKTKSGEVKKTEFPKEYFMMKVGNFFDKSQ